MLFLVFVCDLSLATDEAQYRKICIGLGRRVKVVSNQENPLVLGDVFLGPWIFASYWEILLNKFIVTQAADIGMTSL